MLVAASTDCFADLTLEGALGRLLDLEYTCVEIALRENGNQLKPSQVLGNLEDAIQACRETHRLKPVAYSTDFAAPDDATYYKQFAACCKLAKATRVVSITVRSGELGTPFNAEVERLRELVKISSAEGVLVSVKSEIGHMTQDPATAIVLCDNVQGIGHHARPSHYITGPLAGVNYDHVMKYVYHVQLRDTTKDKLQVRVGQGQVEYGRLVSQLGKVHYDRALAVDIRDLPESGIEQAAELRKLRLLLESLM